MNIVYLSPLKLKESSIWDEKSCNKKIEAYSNSYSKMNFLNWTLRDLLVFELFYENVSWMIKNSMGWMSSDDSRVAMN